MRIAALYDIHGNLPALEAVVAEVRRAAVDAVVVGGDVLPGPMPRETLACLAALDVPVHYLRGNGDRVVCAERRGDDVGSEVPAAFRDVIRWSAAALADDEAARIERWPATVRLHVRGLGDVLFCHGTPRSDVEIFTRLTAEERLFPAFDGVDAAVVVCGHTHMPFDRTGARHPGGERRQRRHALRRPGRRLAAARPRRLAAPPALRPRGAPRPGSGPRTIRRPRRLPPGTSCSRRPRPTCSRPSRRRS